MTNPKPLLPTETTLLQGVPDGAEAPRTRARVTARAFGLGIVLAAGLAALNCWIETIANVHFLGGIQMPFGAVFALGFIILVFNWPLRAMQKIALFRQIVPPFSGVELLTIYAMLIFAATISTPGTDNFFLTTGPTLFYFSTRENRWADLFYNHVPSWFAPGWDGATYQKEIIEPLYLGGLAPAQIPWHAWTAMLIAWSVFLLLIYSSLFFISLLLRKQWIENEALSFPLVQVPLQMVESGEGIAPGTFWRSQMMWSGFALAASFQVLRGLSAHYPDWPNPPLTLGIQFTESPWNAVGYMSAEIYFGAIGLAYLLTREVSLSFWVFFLLLKLELIFATLLGFPTAILPKDAYLGRPTFITFQSAGGWFALAALLVWSARGHLAQVAREAWNPRLAKQNSASEEPFSARSVLLGLVFSFGGLLAWSYFAGLNLAVAVAFFGVYFVASLVLARLVVEGGFLFPQVTFSPTELMNSTVFAASNLGASDLTKLAFVQPVLVSDMRTNVLPGFLHTLKIAHELKLDRHDVRRLMGSIAVVIPLTLVVTVFASLSSLYGHGGLGGYTWFSYAGPQNTLNSAASAMNGPAASGVNSLWMTIGAAIVWFLTLMRSRFLWFPLHPLGFIVASGYPMQLLWFSFFLGWLIKTLVLRFGGSQGQNALRPFMLGLILGNLSAMVLWMLVGLRSGLQIPFWPA